MGGIDRRDIMLAGAGATLLAACGEGGETNEMEPTANDCDPYGFPSDTVGSAQFNKPGDPRFEPRYVCLVYLRFADAMVTARHAYYDIAGYNAVPDDAAKADWARKRLVSAATGKWEAEGLWPAEAGYPNPRENFQGFDFGSQQVIYFYIDNGGAVKFDPNNGIRFSAYATKTGRPTAKDPKKPKVDKNSAFFGARIIADDLLYLENWFTNKNGKLVDASSSETMSMDIHLLMKTADGQMDIPIVIDPDTGNGLRRP